MWDHPLRAPPIGQAGLRRSWVYVAWSRLRDSSPQHPRQTPRDGGRQVGQLELATVEWVDWFNHRKLASACGHIPPAEFEDQYYRHNRGLEVVEAEQLSRPLEPGAVHLLRLNRDGIGFVPISVSPPS